MESKTICIYPWIHMYANPNGSVLPCCVADPHKHLGNVQNNTIKEIWNGDKYKLMRQKMLAGERCEECSGCYRQEDNGIESIRQGKNKTYSKYMHLINNTNPDGSLDEMNLRHFDIRWSNICNFKCRSCSSTYSSTWAQEDIANGHKKPVYIIAGGSNNDQLYDQFIPHFSNIETFYFAGGEPLLTDKHYDILEHLISIGKTDVKLEYNTNLSILKYKSKSVIDLWKNFSNVHVHASIDSWGERAEFIREGTEWAVIENNIHTIRKEAPHVKLHTGSVISIFNVYTIPDFLDYLFKNKLFDPNTYSPYFYNIITPEIFSADILDNNFKNLIIDKLSSVDYGEKINQQLQKVITYVKNSTYDPILKEKFLSSTFYFDNIRNRNFLETFPELNYLY
jgi:radical SAM protein with 4Fe4S-binding SPASM domain